MRNGGDHIDSYPSAKEKQMEPNKSEAAAESRDDIGHEIRSVPISLRGLFQFHYRLDIALCQVFNGLWAVISLSLWPVDFLGFVR
jgi:hypothetical protein